MGVHWVVAATIVALSTCACGAGSDVETRADRHDDTRTDDERPNDDDGNSDDAEATALTDLPPPAPRWAAVWTPSESEPSVSDVSILRFDDVGRPEVFELADGADELIRKEWVSWSPEGTHLALLSCDRDTLIPSLFVASASDDFERRSVDLEFEPTTEPGCGDVEVLNSVSWMGPDTLFAAVLSQEQKLYHRIGVENLEVELLGSIAYSQPFTTSPFGALYVLGTPEVSWDLWFAAETGEPRRMGTKPDALLFTSNGPLTWGPDGQSATWWTQWPADSSSADVTSGSTTAPQFEIVPGQLPKVGHIHIPTGLVVDRHPKGDLSTSFEFLEMAVSPLGSVIAYAIYRRPVASFGADQRITLIRDGNSSPISGGVGAYGRATFGFLDEERFFYSSGREPQEPDGDRSVAVVLRTGTEVRELSVDRYAPFHFDAFRNENRLYFVRTGVDRHTSLWSVDVGDPNARAEQVSIEGSVVQDSVLKQGQVQPLPYHDVEEAELGQALLLASSDDDECKELQRGCQTARWVVSFETGVEVVQLNDAWLEGIVSWAPDGLGLIVLSTSGLSYVPGPSYRGSISVGPDVVGMVLPTRWPAAGF